MRTRSTDRHCSHCHNERMVLEWRTSASWDDIDKVWYCPDCGDSSEGQAERAADARPPRALIPGWVIRGIDDQVIFCTREDCKRTGYYYNGNGEARCLVHKGDAYA